MHFCIFPENILFPSKKAIFRENAGSGKPLDIAAISYAGAGKEGH